MKKHYLQYTLLAALAMGAVTPYTALADTPAVSTEADIVIDVPDVNLKALINEALGKGQDETITLKDLESLTTLEHTPDDKVIKDLKGLDKAIHLKPLNLTNTENKDFHILDALTDKDLEKVNIKVKLQETFTNTETKPNLRLQNKKHLLK